MGSIEKFAWLPIKVNTWRNTKAWVWMQNYRININSSPFSSLNGNSPEGFKYCNRIEGFSFEVRR